KAAGNFDGDVREFGGTRAGGNSGNLRLSAERTIDGIEQHFRRQTAGDGVRVVDFVVGIPAIGGDRKLVRSRLADQLHDVTDIEAALDEFLGEIVEQRG